jgi:hypothetical protein
MPAKARKEPSDHKAKNGTAPVYEFDWEGHTYQLPPAETAVPNMPGRLLRDAYMEGEEGQMRLGFAMLEHVDADPAAVAALYDMPAPDMLDHLQDWMKTRAEETAATVGESSRSLS